MGGATHRDLAGCVSSLVEVHRLDGYPACWPEEPVGWLQPAGLVAAWVAEDQGEVLGHACLVDASDDPMFTGSSSAPGQLLSVSRLFVDPRGRGQGLGASLLGAATALASSHERPLVLDVVDDAAAAIALYERLGWRMVDRRQADWSTPSGIRPKLRVYASP